MKFEVPAIEIKKFDLRDVLTASGDEGQQVSQLGYAMEGDCVGNASDNFVPNCV